MIMGVASRGMDDLQLTERFSALTSAERSIREIIHRAQMTRMHQLLEDVSGVSMERFWFRLLLVLDEDSPRRPRDLTQMLAVDSAQVSRALTALEVAGLVRRSASELDRRGSLVDLTAAGQAAVQQMLAAALTVFDAVVADWSLDDVVTLDALMQRWAKDLRRYTDELLGNRDELTIRTVLVHQASVAGETLPLAVDLGQRPA